jgi:hypothetical protein
MTTGRGLVRTAELRPGRAVVETWGDTSVAHPLDRPVRMMLQVAMLIFTYTIVIGILNGLDLVEFSRQQLLSHLHGGTLGWMTLAILGVTLWLFGGATGGGGGGAAGSVRPLAALAAVAIAAYVLAFATTAGALRPLAGVATLVALAGFAAFAYRRAGAIDLTVPHLLVLIGLTSSLIGGAFGVFNGLAIAFAWDGAPAVLFEAHPATMEVGFIIPTAMALAEWGVRRGHLETPITRAGKAQAGLMLLAFLWVLGFTLLDQPEVAGMGIVFAIIGLIVFYARLGRSLRATSPTTRSPERHALVGALWLGVTIVYIFVIIQMAGGDFGAIPRERLITFIHLMAIGATTNALLAFVVHLSRRVSPAGVVDDVVFWGVNVGLAGFAFALTAELPGLYAVFVPVMGLGLLVAIAAHLGPLRREPPPAATAAPHLTHDRPGAPAR